MYLLGDSRSKVQQVAGAMASRITHYRPTPTMERTLQKHYRSGRREAEGREAGEVQICFAAVRAFTSSHLHRSILKTLKQLKVLEILPLLPNYICT